MARVASLLGTSAVLALGALALLQGLPGPTPARGPDGNRVALAGPGQDCDIGLEGFLRGRLFGDLDASLAWTGTGLRCQGMRKPDGQGIRLYFSGPRPDGAPLSVLIGIEGRLEDMVGAERPANITVIDEGTGRFFSSGGPGRCWVRVAAITPLPARRAGQRVEGLAFCVGALPSMSDRGSVTLGDLAFAGIVGPDAG
jgi:hypothetical protein